MRNRKLRACALAVAFVVAITALFYLSAFELSLGETFGAVL